MNNIDKLKEIINNSKNIVVISGAGISTPSGIPDIRSSSGISNNKDLINKYGHDYETIVSHAFFYSKTDEFYKFYKEQMVYKNAKPNIAHLYLKQLEKSHNVTIITQNIDGLHTKAGSKNVIEFHGSVNRNKCLNCGKQFSLDYILNYVGVPKCDSCGGIIKPDVVLFNEGINEDDIINSIRETQKADLMLIIGSSLLVYPAAGIPSYFRGKHIVIINKSPTYLDSRAELVFRENIIDVIKQIID